METEERVKAELGGDENPEVAESSEEIITLEDFKKELAEEGYSPLQISDILEALRVVYIGQEKPETIGVPHQDVDELYKTKLEILMRKDMVHTVKHAGAYDYGYRCTEKGEAVAREEMQRFLNENLERIKKELDLYPKKLLKFYFDYSYQRTDSGHLTSRISQLSFKYAVQKLIKAWDVLEICERLRRKLVNFGVAVETFDKKITVIAPEFADFIEEYVKEVYAEETNYYGVFKTLHDYANRRITEREELVKRLSRYNFTEEELIELINETSELGLTSEYTDYSDEENAKKEPFAILDYEGFIAYIEERFAIPFKEAILENTQNL